MEQLPHYDQVLGSTRARSIKLYIFVKRIDINAALPSSLDRVHNWRSTWLNQRFQQVPGRAAIKRHVQVMPVDLVKQGRYSTQNLGNILHKELQRHHPAYCRVLSTLPLVIKYMPKAIKKSLTAKAKSKNLKLAVRLLKRWGLYSSLMA